MQGQGHIWGRRSIHLGIIYGSGHISVIPALSGPFFPKIPSFPLLPCAISLIYVKQVENFAFILKISVEKFWLEFRKALPLHPLSPFSGVGGTKRKSSLTDCTDRSSTRKRHAPSPCIQGMWVVPGIRCRTVNVILKGALT